MTAEMPSGRRDLARAPLGEFNQIESGAELHHPPFRVSLPLLVREALWWKNGDMKPSQTLKKRIWLYSSKSYHLFLTAHTNCVASSNISSCIKALAEDP